MIKVWSTQEFSTGQVRLISVVKLPAWSNVSRRYRGSSPSAGEAGSALICYCVQSTDISQKLPQICFIRNTGLCLSPLHRHGHTIKTLFWLHEPPTPSQFFSLVAILLKDGPLVRQCIMCHYEMD